MTDQTTQPTQPAAPQGNQSDAEKNKGMAIVAYFIFFIPLLAAKDSKFAMYHANQGLNLLLFWVVGNIGLMILSFILGITLILAILIPLLWLVYWIAGIVFLVMGIINASKGEMKQLPLIGKLNIIK